MYGCKTEVGVSASSEEALRRTARDTIAWLTHVLDGVRGLHNKGEVVVLAALVLEEIRLRLLDDDKW